MLFIRGHISVRLSSVFFFHLALVESSTSERRNLREVWTIQLDSAALYQTSSRAQLIYAIIGIDITGNKKFEVFL